MRRRYFTTADFALAIGLYHLTIKNNAYLELGRDFTCIMLMVIAVSLFRLVWEGTDDN